MPVGMTLYKPPIIVAGHYQMTRRCDKAFSSSLFSFDW